MKRVITTAVLCVLVGMASTVGATPAGSHDEWTRSEVFVTGKGRLGVQAFGLNDELRTFFGAAAGKGILVGHVESGTPAAKAGVKVGDVITAVAGMDIADIGDVFRALGTHHKGDLVELTIVRDRHPIVLAAKLDSEPGAMPMLDRDVQKQIDEMNQRLRQLEQEIFPPNTKRT